MHSNLRSNFYAGLYSEILATTVDAASPHWERADAAFLVGSLCFVGRVEEARLMFAAEEAAMDPSLRIEARFYLAIATGRHNQGHQARRLLAQSTAELKHFKGPTRGRAEFFVFQGLAFYRYLGGRLKRALYWAKLAYERAFLQKFSYGRMLSLDIIGHCQIRMDNVRAGFQSLQMAEKICDQIGDGANLQAIRAAITLYRSYFGISGAEDLVELQTSIDATTGSDSYTAATLLIEKARVLVFRGSVDRAQQELNAACQLVYQVENPVLEAELNLALAMHKFRRGEFQQALAMVQNAVRRTGDTNDLITALRCRGFELMLLDKLGNAPDRAAALEAQVEAMTLKSGAAVAARMIARRKRRITPTWTGSTLQMSGQDPIGDIHDLIDSNPEAAIREVLTAGYYGLLPDCLRLDPQFRGIIFGIEHSSVTVFDRGNVQHYSPGWPRLVVKLIEALSRGETSREHLVRAVWGQEYRPNRHDPLLYALVSRTRRLLEDNERWIEVTESGYALARGIKVVIRDVERDAVQANGNLDPGGYLHDTSGLRQTESNQRKKNPEVRDPNLNLRQIRILELFDRHSAVSTKLIRTELQASEVTASRDLALLTRLGYTLRLGRGRSVMYVRQPSSEGQIKVGVSHENE
jgi:hypothetical protein